MNTKNQPKVIIASESKVDNDRPSSSARPLKMFGFLTIFFIFLGLGGWAGTAPLSRAVSAPANFEVEGKRKKIQHLEGGIVAGLFVQEGQFVEEGQLLLKLDPLAADAGFNRLKNKLNQVLIREARLNSELANEASIILRPEILTLISKTPKVIEIIEAEEKQFFARKASFEGQVGILQQREDQLKKELAGLSQLKTSRSEQLKVFSDEIEGLRRLYEKGYYPKSKILAMERAMIELKGAIGSDEASIARAQSAMGETKRQIINVRQRFREAVVDELRRVQADISDFREQTLVAQDILARIEIRAPRSGLVQGLAVHTIGGVVGVGDVIMEIVPQNEKLIIEARVSPTDIDSLQKGQMAEVRLTALSVNKTPTIYGEVVSVSGDSLLDQASRQSYFLSRVEIPKDELVKLGDVKLSPGMPAEVLINVGDRTVLEYIFKPLTDAFARGLNEE